MKIMKKFFGGVIKFLGIVILLIIVFSLGRCSAIRDNDTDDWEREEITQDDDSASEDESNGDESSQSEEATENEVADNGSGSDNGDGADTEESNSETEADNGNASAVVEDASDTETETTLPEENSDEAKLVNGMRPEFKEAMDSYEAFYDEYCAFMKKYNANPTDTSLLKEYSDMMSKMLEMDEKFNEWEGNDLNTEELKYYAEVSNRITQKLLSVAE